MENDIPSEHSGVVKAILVAEGENLQEGQAILVVEEAKAEAKPVEAKAAVAGKKVTAPLPGKVLEVCVKVGDTVKAGQKVAVLEAMKMENDIMAPADGVVATVNVAQGASVATDEVLVTLN